jgi:glyoxylase-like metal-dependent hydrolase (beta-lactamase superfamily II)
VVPTPGHTVGHVVYHDERARLLFTGDHILPSITPSIGLEPASGPWPLRDYLDSLLLIKSRPDALLLPAHGPVRASAHARVDELLAHHDDRLGEILKVVTAGASDAYAAAQALTWTHRQRRFAELDSRNQAMAVRETLAHLQVLMLDGLVSASVDETGTERFG